MSTLVSQPAPPPSWKQEVNRRIEAHKNRRGLSVVDENSAPEGRSGVSGRAAQAAARVAERFAKAPSYDEMQASEARAALRNAEAATRAALEAQAAARTALEHFERSAAKRSLAFPSEVENDDQADFFAGHPDQSVETGPLSVRFWEPAAEPVLALAEPEYFESSFREERVMAEALSSNHGNAAEENWDWNGQPIHANLIQFPRELIATRRIRPRLADTEIKPEEARGQLSIFEVDPSTISTEAAVPMRYEGAAPSPSWSGPEWTRLELEREPDALKDAPPAVAAGHAIHLAPFELRMMAATIDFALVVAMVAVGALGIASHLVHPMSIKTAESGAGIALLAVAALYQAFFLLTTMSTPGMLYAGLSLCTFDDEVPTRVQLRDRLGALMVSLLPMGLGLVWSVFDEDHLSWHDRLSRTYQRRC